MGSQHEVHEPPEPDSEPDSEPYGDTGDPRERCATAAALLERDRPQEALDAMGHGQVTGVADWAYRLLSLSFERLGRDAEAVAAAEEAVRTAPGSWTARLRLGAALRRVPGRRWEAAVQADRAVRYAPEEPDPHVLAGDLALLRGEHHRAEAAYRAALRLADDHPRARVNLGLALLRWRPPHGHHDPAWPVDPRETARTRDAVEAWSRQIRALLAVALAVAALLVLRTGPAAAAVAGGVTVLAGVAITLRRGREIRLWRYVPRLLARDPWLGVSVSATVLAVVAYTVAVATLPPVPQGVVWPLLAGFVLFNGIALPALRVPARAWRGRPVRALAEFAAIPGDRTARRNAETTLWMLTARAWSALMGLLLAAGALGEIRPALAAPAVPVALALARPRGTAGHLVDRVLAADRLLTATRYLLTLTSVLLTGVAVVTSSGLLTGAGLERWTWWVWWACGVPPAVLAGALALRAARARGHDLPGPWRSGLAMREGHDVRPPADARAPILLGGDVRRALARVRGVVLAFTDREGPRTLAAEVTGQADGELLLTAPADAWEAAGRDPRVTVFVTDPAQSRFWAEVRGVAVGDVETGALRITPKRVLVSEVPGLGGARHRDRHRRRRARERHGTTRTR
ncbi:tetratricopeptide repeat protein [Streptosporangium sp. NPDC049376]|uniref:tetratricopeptide repeat protein n=1 Tax=Streptosporangium sp. NPDC049376 TaxID=3366192 RepID=UPI00379D6F3D